MTFSFRFKLISFTFCIVLVVGGAISLYTIYQGHHRILTTFRRECHDITAMIAEMVTNDVYALNLRSLHYRLANTRINPNISYTFITDEQGVVLSDGTVGNERRDQPLLDAFSVDILHANAWLSRIEVGVLKMGGPLRLPDGRRIGTLQVGFLLERAYHSMHETTSASLLLTVLCLGIGAILAVLFSAHFSRPLAAMLRVAKEIGAGKLETRVPITRRDEFGTLAAAINEMAANLGQSEAVLQQKLVEIRTLYEIGQEITAQVALGPTLQLIVERARALCQATLCLLALRQNTDEPFAFQAVSGTLPAGLPAVRFRPGEGVCGRVAMTATPLLVNDYLQEYPDSPSLEVITAVDIRSAVAVPMQMHQTVSGVLMVTSPSPHQFRPEDQQLLSALADHAAIAIENAQLYEQVRQHAEALEAQVIARTYELQASNAQLKEFDRLKSEFVSDVSHELRTPLTVIKGFIDHLLEGIAGNLSPPQRAFLTRVQANIARLARLINDLLDLAQIEAGQVHIHPVKLLLTEVIAEVLETLRPLAMETGIELGLVEPETVKVVWADRDKVEQVLMNLIHNAIKFTPPGRAVHVRVAVQPQGEVLTVVQDTGEGIPPEELEHIFEKFHQVSTAPGQPRGSGLGLAISKKLIELQEGTMWVRSALGQGSEFGFTLPAAAQEVDG